MKQREILTCKYCGIPLTTNIVEPPMFPQVDIDFYCSEKCLFYDKHITCPCKNCGKKFITYKTPTKKRVYCSRECQSEYKKKHTVYVKSKIFY